MGMNEERLFLGIVQIVGRRKDEKRRRKI